MPRDPGLDALCTGNICVDFDGTIVQKSDDFPAIGELIPGAEEALVKLFELGFKLTIFSARPDIWRIEKWLEQHPVLDNIIDHVTNVKPTTTTLFVDDRAYRFEGDWSKALDDISRIMSYHKKCESEAVPKPE